MKKLAQSSGIQVAYEEVDVVTTGTFGAMCSSGAIINLGHADPPMMMGIKYLCLGHNTIGGASGAGILSAELMAAKGIL